jgi:hypothetical protein
VDRRHRNARADFIQDMGTAVVGAVWDSKVANDMMRSLRTKT